MPSGPLTAFLVLALAGICSAACGASDDAGDCSTLRAIAEDLDVSSWNRKANWLVAGVSVCRWHGVDCNKAGRVKGM